VVLEKGGEREGAENYRRDFLVEGRGIGGRKGEIEMLIGSRL